jgi:MtrB/PioB family decaheme-associated outer membrane protein
MQRQWRLLLTVCVFPLLLSRPAWAEEPPAPAAGEVQPAPSAAEPEPSAPQAPAEAAPEPAASAPEAGPEPAPAAPPAPPAAAPAAVPPLAAGGRCPWKLQAIGGLEGVAGDPDSSKFEEYRDVPRGAFLSLFCLSREQPDGRHLELTLQNFARADEWDVLSTGQWGRYLGYLSLNKIPHRLSNTSELIFQSHDDNSVYTLPLPVREAFEGFAADSDMTGFEGLVSSLERPFPLSFQRTAWGGGAAADRGAGFSYFGSYQNESREGTEPIGTTFSFTNEVELPEPIDYVTQDLDAGAQYVGGLGPLQLTYWGQWFQNDNRAITWDNPIQTVDQVGSSARGRMALPPTNTSQTLTLSGAANFTPRARLVATLSGAHWSQDEALLPSTINSALTVEPLPVTHSDIQVDTSLINMVFTDRLDDQTLFTARWNRYRMSDDRPSFLFQQVITDTSVDDFEDSADQLTSIRVEDLSGDLSYAYSRRLALDLGFNQNQTDRKRGDVRHATEGILRIGANYLVNGTTAVRFFYNWADRNIGPYVPVSEEQAPDLRKYDEAARDRQQGGLIAQFSPNERWDWDLALNLQSDDYDESALGLVSDRVANISLDGAYSLDAVTNAYLGISYERIRSHLRSRFRPVVGGEPVDDPANDWESFQRNRDWTYWLGLDRAIVPGEWHGGACVSYTDGHGVVDAVGVPGGAPQSEPPPWPDVDFRYLALDLYADHRLNGTTVLRFQYGYERYRETDFVQDIMVPYMGFIDSGSATSIYLGARQPGYGAHIFSVSALLGF